MQQKAASCDTYIVMFYKIISISTRSPNLAEQVEALIEQQKDIRCVLPGEILAKKIKIEGKPFIPVFSEPRTWRKMPAEQLKYLGITLPKEPSLYECIMPGSDSKYVHIINENTYQSLSTIEKSYTRKSWLLNEDQKVLKVFLSGHTGNKQLFHIGANYMPCGKDHSMIWMPPEINNGKNVGLRQVYHGLDLLYWVDDLLRLFNNTEHRLFYNSLGTGNSSDILHFQGMKEKFPAFAQFTYSYPNLNTSRVIFTRREDWPFRGFLARYIPETKQSILKELHRYIKAWLRRDPRNTFNLLAQSRLNGRGIMHEIFVVKRKFDLYCVEGMTNEFSGAEVGGRILLPNREEYENFQDIEHFQWDYSRLN